MVNELKRIVFELYGIDLDKENFEKSSSLHSTLLRFSDRALRISVKDTMSREEKMAKTMWADDLKDFKATICEPMASNNNKFIENAKLKNWNVSFSLYRTAKGKVPTAEGIRPMFLICAGDMLGSIHYASMDQNSIGMKYKIPKATSQYYNAYKKAESHLSGDLKTRIGSIITKSQAIAETEENYGVCYGEYDLYNLIVDNNNIYLFDFDKSVYAHFLYDVASFMVSILSTGYMPNFSARHILYKNLIPWFRVGYSINKFCEPNAFDNIEIFMGCRLIWLLITLLNSVSEDSDTDRKDNIDRLKTILLHEDILEGIDAIRGYKKNA